MPNQSGRTDARRHTVNEMMRSTLPAMETLKCEFHTDVRLDGGQTLRIACKNWTSKYQYLYMIFVRQVSMSSCNLPVRSNATAAFNDASSSTPFAKPQSVM